MIIPTPSNSLLSSGSQATRIFPRKGGGGGGGGHGSSGGGGRGSSSGSGKSSSSSGSGGGSSKPGSFGVPSGKSSVSASPSSRGGGTAAVIPSGSLFAGRLSGGATRDQIYGNSRIGSGYTYGGYGSYYGGRPFPYVFFPIYIVPGYYGGDEYGPNANVTRPGGQLSTAVVQPSTSSNNASSQDSYYLVGDQSSVSAVLASLVSQCGVSNSTVTNTYINGTLSFNGTALVPHPENMVQYYRASSFALALSTYNNSAASLSRAPASNDSTAPPLSEDTPLPAGLNMTLLACLNSTIAANVPLLDTDSGKHGLTEIQITQIVLGSISAVFILWYIWASGLCHRRRTKK